MARYMMNTHPSWDAASYTVKKLVAKQNNKHQTTIKDDNVLLHPTLAIAPVDI